MSSTGSAYFLSAKLSDPDRKTHFRERSGENDDFVDFAHFSQEVIDSGTLNDIYVVRLGLNLDGDDVIGRG